LPKEDDPGAQIKALEKLTSHDDMTDHPCRHLYLERKVATAAEEAGLPAGMAKIGCRSNHHAKEKTPKCQRKGLVTVWCSGQDVYL